MKNESEKIDEILIWIKQIGKIQIRKFISECLSLPQERVLYQNSDGEKGYNELKKIVKMTDKTILDYWDKWEKLEILEKIPAKGGKRGKRLFDLEELGIEISEID